MKSLLLFFFAATCLTANAQDWHSDKYTYGELYEGYVITNEGERIDGFIKYRNRMIMQEEVIFYKAKDNPSSKERYLAGDLEEYMVGDKLYHCINYSGGNGRNKSGNLVINDKGCIKEYVWYTPASGYKTMKQREGETDEDFGNRKFPSTQVFYKKGDEIAVDKDYFKADFAKNMYLYVKDNKELAKKVKSGASGYDRILNLMDIIKEYNDGCK